MIHSMPSNGTVWLLDPFAESKYLTPQIMTAFMITPWSRTRIRAGARGSARLAIAPKVSAGIRVLGIRVDEHHPHGQNLGRSNFRVCGNL